MPASEHDTPSSPRGGLNRDRSGHCVIQHGKPEGRMAMRARIALAVMLCLGLALPSCSSSPETDAARDAGMNGAEASIPIEDFKLSTGDKLHLTVFNEDNISGDYDIDTEGLISVPLAGLVKADGLTKAALESKVAEKLNPLLKNPRVTISVVSFRPFYVIGEVEKPGEYQFRNGLNVISAMAIAGGNTYRASKTSVLIQRGGIGDFREYSMSPLIKVYPGDLLKVPERFF